MERLEDYRFNNNPPEKPSFDAPTGNETEGPPSIIPNAVEQADDPFSSNQKRQSVIAVAAEPVELDADAVEKPDAVSIQATTSPKPSKLSCEIPLPIEHAIMEELAARVAVIDTDTVKKNRILNKLESHPRSVAKSARKKSDIFDSIHNKHFQKMDGIDSHYAAKSGMKQSTVTVDVKPGMSHKRYNGAKTLSGDVTAKPQLKRKATMDPGTLSRPSTDKKQKVNDDGTGIETKPPLRRSSMRYAVVDPKIKVEEASTDPVCNSDLTLRHSQLS